MKRLFMHSGHSSTRSIFLTTFALGCVCFLAVLGISQALATGGPANPAPPSLNERTGGTTIHIFPSPGSRILISHGAHGELGERCEKGYCPTPPLLYKGGKGVQHNPEVYLILWGSNWSKTGLVLSGQLIKMYKSLSGSKYQGILTQYFDSSGRVGTTLKVISFTDTAVTAPTSVTKAGLQEEVDSTIKANNWANNSNSQFVVIPAPGATYATGFNSGFCGYHGVTEKDKAIYTFVANATEEPFKNCAGYDKGKNGNNVTSMVASHEYSESATDPNPVSPTWVTKDLYEIGDICIKGDDEILGVWVQGEWDNYQNECSLSDPSPAFVYTITEPGSELTETTATLNGVVNPEGLETKYHFEYGSTPAYGTSTAEESVVTNSTNQSVKKGITGLSTHTAYYYTVVAKNSKGTAKGRQQKFETP
jgi:hypothetical protein